MATRSRLKNMGTSERPMSNSNVMLLPKSSSMSEVQKYLSMEPKAVPEHLVKQGLASGTQSYYTKWKEADQKGKRVAEQERLAAERVLAETSSLLHETSRQLKENTKEMSSRLHQRMDDVNFWRSELESKAVEVDNQRDCLSALQTRLKATLENVCQPLMESSEQCLAHRRQRLGDDRVDDGVEKHLRLELDTCKQIRSMLKQSVMELEEEKRVMSKTLLALENDLKDKKMAKDIDQATDNLRLVDNSKRRMPKDGLGPQQGVKSRASISVSSWSQRSHNLLEMATGHMSRSVSLHSLLESLLSKVSSQMLMQKRLTDNAIDRRIKEFVDSKTELEQELSETEIKMREVEESLETLEKALESKRHPLQLCQLRIDHRKQRPHLELVRDQVDNQLEKEKESLVLAVQRLENQLKVNRGTLVKLKQARLQLKNQVEVKNQSLYVDQVLCKNLRQTVAVNNY